MADPPPACSRCRSEKLGSLLSLCTDSEPMSDSYLRWYRCSDCDARYIVRVKEDVTMSHDADGHVVNQGYSCDPGEWDRTLATARRCPKPDDSKCGCPAHTTDPVTLEAAWYRSW